MKTNRLSRDLEYLDEIRRELRGYSLPDKLDRVFNELLIATWNIAIGEHVKACDLKRSMAYKGAVALARQALSNVDTELLDGRRRQSGPVQGSGGAADADAGSEGGTPGSEGVPDTDGGGDPDGRA